MSRKKFDRESYELMIDNALSEIAADNDGPVDELEIPFPAEGWSTGEQIEEPAGESSLYEQSSEHSNWRNYSDDKWEAVELDPMDFV
jgi:hypothetical protein